MVTGSILRCISGTRIVIIPKPVTRIIGSHIKTKAVSSRIKSRRCRISRRCSCPEIQVRVVRDTREIITGQILNRIGVDIDVIVCLAREIPKWVNLNTRPTDQQCPAAVTEPRVHVKLLNKRSIGLVEQDIGLGRCIHPFNDQLIECYGQIRCCCDISCIVGWCCACRHCWPETIIVVVNHSRFSGPTFILTKDNKTGTTVIGHVIQENSINRRTTQNKVIKTVRVNVTNSSYICTNSSTICIV